MSYLKRLALRALGHAGNARLLPRMDARASLAPERVRSEATLSGAEAEAQWLPHDAHDGSGHVPAARVAAARGGLASSDEAAPSEAPPSLPRVESHAGQAPASSRPAARSAGSSHPAIVVGDGAEAASAAPNVGDAAPSRALPVAAMGRKEQSAVRSASTDEGGDRGAARIDVASVGPMPSPLRVRAPRRLGGSWEASAPSAPRGSDTVREAHAVADAAARVRASLQSVPARETTARSQPDSIKVEIGRIEVRVAPPPPAPPARSRPAPAGFEGYWRMRNYLDRAR